MSPVLPCPQPRDKSHLPQQVLALHGSRKLSLTPASGTPPCSFSRHTEGERDHKCCRKFPIHSGIGFLKAFNNGQTLTLVFLHYFAYLKQMPHLIFFWTSQRFLYLCCPYSCEHREVQQYPEQKIKLKFQREVKTIHA